MLILTIRTDKPEAEISLYKDDQQLTSLTWPAHRQLAETIHIKIKELLESQGHTLSDIQGIAAFQGPGSFTGLRIGLSVANALADAKNIPIVAVMGDDWIVRGQQRLLKGENDQLVLPEYGSAPHITLPRN